jgi:hypothetical protein
MSAPGGEWVGRTYKSLERPAEYFGCHISFGIASIIVAAGSLLAFAFTDFLTGFCLFLAGLALAGGMVKIGRMASKYDPFWPDAMARHFFDQEDYLDV